MSGATHYWTAAGVCVFCGELQPATGPGGICAGSAAPAEIEPAQPASSGGSWDAMVTAELAELAEAGITVTVCHDCGRSLLGDRAAARALRWEPYSSRSQAELDAGPMVCPECIGRLLADLDVAMRAAAARGVDVAGAAQRILFGES